MLFQFLTLLNILSLSQAATTLDACASLTSLALENTTITAAFYQKAATNISTVTYGCEASDNTSASLVTTADVCRVQGFVNTTLTSLTKFEAWLPDTWYGRFMGIGNGGDSGCYDWSNIIYSSQLHFAVINSNNGHDGLSGAPFLNHPEVINDFTHRSIHAEAVVGKQIVEAYYGKKPSKSYYSGCSTGGRQAFQTAMLYPEDFDGIVGGSPAVNWNNLMGAMTMFAKYVDTPYARVDHGFISAELWPVVSLEILKQCDSLDGLVDGIISEPDNCSFNPEPLLCQNSATDGCLSPVQVEALRKIYFPILGSQGDVLFPRFDPGAEEDSQWQNILGGQFFAAANDWYKYAVYNNSDYSFDNFSASNIEFGDSLNVGDISTYSGDLSAFKARGGKFLTYHGRSDPIIPSGNSNRMFQVISSKLGMESLDDFYRFFRIPGMQHCFGGRGAWAFGQGSYLGLETNLINDTSHNILLSLVDWVEGGEAPDVIVGLDTNGTARTHCRYPYESRWNGTQWACV